MHSVVKGETIGIKQRVGLNFILNWSIAIFLVLSLWPGIGTNDSFTQILGFQSGNIDSSHSVTMTIIWGVLFDITGNFGSMMMAIVAITAAAIHNLMKSTEVSWARWVFILFWLSPWVLNFINVVWKDVFMASLFLLSSSLVLRNHKHKKLSSLLSASVITALSLGVRGNAVLAALPFIIYVGFQVFKMQRSKVLGVISLGLVTLFTFLPSVIIEPAFGSQSVNRAEHAMVDDLAVISLASGESLVPQRSFEEIEKCGESSYFGLPRNGFIRCLGGYNFGENGLRGKIPTSLWFTSVTGNLDVYIPHAVDKYWSFLWHDGTPYSYSRPFTATSNNELPDEIGWNFQQNTTSYAKDYWVEIWAKLLPILFLPLFWLVASVGILFASVRRKTTPLSLTLIVLSSSSSLYLLGYAIFNHGADFRYALWPTWAVTISGLIFIVQALESKLRVA